MNKLRIGLVGISHESNTFIDTLTTIDDFHNGHFFLGKAIIEEYRDAHHEIGGMMEVLGQHPVELVPIMYAEATPGGKIASATSSYLVDLLLELVADALPLAGLLVAPHGAAVSESHDDFDGHWLSEVRRLVGNIPIMGTLDLHANVSERMASAVDALVAYKTNPHMDQRDVGAEVALIMIKTLNGAIRPTQVLTISKVVISIEQQHTATEPCLSLYALVEKISQVDDVLSISVLMGFPYADVSEMGASILVVTNRAPSQALSIGTSIAAYIYRNRHKFNGKKTSIEEALDMLDQLTKPVLLLDMGDNVGGGSPGDGTLLLHALEERESTKSFVCIYDPEAVNKLDRMSSEHSSLITLGAKTDRRHGPPFTGEVSMWQMVDGKFTELAPHHGGQVHFDMGRTAIVKTRGNTIIMITSLRMPPFSIQQLLHFGVCPSDFDVVVAKGVQAPIAAYESVCPSIVRVNTAGVTIADMCQLNFRKRRKPLYPFEEGA